MQGVGFVFSKMIRHTGNFTMQVGPAQFLCCDFLAGGGFHQRRAGQKNGAVTLDHDGLVGHGRHIGPAGGAGAEHHRDLRNAGG